MGRLYDDLLKAAATHSSIAAEQAASRKEEMLNMAREVLGNEAQALRWLAQPKVALNGKAPIQLLDSESGFEMVRALLDKVWD